MNENKCIHLTKKNRDEHKKVTLLFFKSIIYFSFMVCHEIYGQNLITNNGFETSISVPNGYGQWYNCQGWSNVNNYIGFAWPYASPDYLRVGAGGGVGLPANTFANVAPFAGNGIMGFIGYYGPSPDFREYLAHALSSPLIPGQSYTVSFYMTNGSSGWYCGSGCNHIGVKFSNGPLTQLTHEPLNIIPDCEISSKWWSSSWQQISFTFIPNASYNYMTLGNFYNDVNTAHATYSAGVDGAYYFIDEMTVTPTIPLPLEWLDFKAERFEGKNLLTWTTISESNSDYFTIQRSLDGNTFKTIGRLAAAGFSTGQNDYHFNDSNVDAIVVYYQLYLTDMDGVQSFSKVVAVKQITTINPVFYADLNSFQTVHVEIPEHADPVNVSLFSISGNLIQTFMIEDNSFSITLPGNGVYLFRLTGKNFIADKKWIIAQ